MPLEIPVVFSRLLLSIQIHMFCREPYKPLFAALAGGTTQAIGNS